MKPIRISIEGFNSFSQKQEIDLERLSSMGLFGIFGPTGSGKSSILDAITFALYGRIARDSGKSSQERYINVHCESARIIFVFDIHAEKKNRYKIIREIKREKGEKVSTRQQKLLLLHEEGQEEVLAEKDAQFRKCIDRIIGLQYEDFIKTVVLPQGGFNEFLKLEGAERRKILERLFGLEQYGEKLEAGIVARLRKAEDRLHVLEGESSAFSDIDEEKESLLKKQLEEWDRERERLGLRKEKSDADVRRSKNIYDTLRRMHELERLMEEDRSRAQGIEEMKREAERAKKADPVLENIEEYEAEKRQSREEALLCIEQRRQNEILAQEAAYREERFRLFREEKEREGEKLLQKRIELEKLARDWCQYEERKKEAARLAILRAKQREAIKKSEGKKTYCESRIAQARERSQEERNFLREHAIDHEYRERLRAAFARFKEKEEEAGRRREAYFALEALEKEAEETRLLLGHLGEEAEKNRRQKEEIGTRILRLRQEPLCDLEYLHNREKLHENLHALFGELKSCGEQEGEALEKRREEEARYRFSRKRIEELERERERGEKEKREAEIRESASLLRLDLRDGDCCPVCRQRIEGIEKIRAKEEDSRQQDELSKLERKIREAEREKSGLTEILAKAELGMERAREEAESAKERAALCLEKLESLKEILGEGEKAEIFERISGKRKEGAIHSESQSLRRLEEIIEDEAKELRIRATDLRKELEEAVQAEKKNEEEGVDIRIQISRLSAKQSSYLENMEGRRADILVMEERIRKLEREFREMYDGASGEAIERELKELIELEKRIEKSREIVDKADEDIAYYTEALSDTLGELRSREIEETRTQAQEKEIQRLLQEYAGEFVKILGALRDPRESLLRVESELERLERAYEAISSEREEAKSLLAKSQTGLAMQEQKLESLQRRIEGMEEALRAKLGGFGLGSDSGREGGDLDGAIRIVKTWKLTKAQIEERESRAEQYQNEMREREGAWKALKEVVGEETLSQEEFERIEEENLLLNREYTELLEKLAAGRDRHAQICRKLERAKEILKEQKSLREHYGMLVELRKITGAKRFVEFMAIRQLRYITLQATKRLDEITGGAYSIEVDEQGIFKIRDNKNGGCLRSVKSLSGGETFVVALALALSLSAHIQLKGVAPLELFFLDEGFGTLDDELLETVIESLEKLHHERLRIGLISHIEYLKQRIPVKLIVEPALAGEGGSRTKIVYS